MTYMTPETVLLKLQKMMNNTDVNSFPRKNQIGIDSLALSLNVKVADLMMHLQILEGEGKIHVTVPKADKNLRVATEKGVIRLSE